VKMGELRVGDVVLNAFGETVNLLVGLTSTTCVWVCLSGPSHFVVGEARESEYDAGFGLSDIWDVYRGDRLLWSGCGTESVEQG